MILSNIDCQSIEDSGSSHALKRKCLLPAIAIVLMVFFFTTSVLSQQFDSPEALVHTRANFQKGDCDLACSIKLADMYSQRFLRLNKESMVATLRSSPDRANDVRILFGSDIAQGKLEKMSPKEVFAHQLLHAGRSIPSEYRYSETEIISKKTISPNEIHIIVRNHGLKAAPNREEEEIIHFIKENGKWKINY